METRKKILIKGVNNYLEKLNDEVAHLYEEHYKADVAVNTIIDLLVERGVFTLDDFKNNMAKIRKKVKES